MIENKAKVKREINGILLVNKPSGMTSNAVLQQVKRIFQAKKAGHTGSLDPMATGMLPVCFGEATKFCQYLLDADKSYEATGLLGIKTNTGDAMGEVISSVETFAISTTTLQNVLSKFLGNIKQVPSMFSALKHHGKPLYKLARAGISIERESREVLIHQLILNHFDGKKMDLTVLCSKGTYIRNLVEDIGEQLGIGAHVTRLHRNYTAGFANERMFTLEDLQSKSLEALDACLLPMDRAVSHFPELILDDAAIRELRQGKIVTDGLTKELIGSVRLYNTDKEFIGLGKLEEPQILKVKRLISYT